MSADEELIAAAAAGDEKTVETLLLRGASVNARDARERTPLHLAAHNGHLGVARTLLRFHPNLDARMDDEGTALHDAVACGHNSIVRLLLTAGANPRLQDEDDSTIFHWAVSEKRLDTLALLIELVPELINVPRNNGRTPLHEAVANNNFAAVKLLLKNDANIYCCDNERQTAIQLAREIRHDAIADYIEQKIIHRAQRTQLKFFDIRRVKKDQVQTRQLAQHYLGFRRATQDSVININGTPTRRLVTADKSAVAESLEGMDEKLLGDMQAVNLHAKWHNNGLQNKGKVNQFGAWEYVQLNEEDDPDNSPQLTICSQYQPVVGQIANFHMSGIGRYGADKKNYILAIIHLATAVHPANEAQQAHNEKGLAQLLLNYSATGQPITKHSLQAIGLQCPNGKAGKSLLQCLNRLCYLAAVKEVSRRMHPDILKNGERVDELAMGLAYVMALRLVKDSVIRMADVFAADAKYGLPTSAGISANTRNVNDKLLALCQLFYTTYPHENASRERMHQLLLAGFGGGYDTDGDEYETSEDEATPRLHGL